MMNCKEITTIVNKIKAQKMDLDDLIDEGKFEEAKSQSDEISAFLEPLMDKLFPEFSKESLEKNQKTLDKLFGQGKFDLQKACREKRILGLDIKQKIIAEKEGYGEFIIIPGQLSRQKVVEAFEKKFTSSLGEGIYWWTSKKEALSIKPVRPKEFYVIAIKKEIKGELAHPEFYAKEQNDALVLLKDEQEKNRELNIHGMTLPEYLIYDCYLSNEYTHSENGRKSIHSDYEQTFLLDDHFYSSIHDEMQVLNASWQNGYCMGVRSQKSGRTVKMCTRLAIMAKNKEIQ